MISDRLTELANLPVLSVLLTLFSFHLGVLAYRFSGNKVILHPVLLGGAVTALVVALLPLQFEQWRL